LKDIVTIARRKWRIMMAKDAGRRSRPAITE